MKAMPAIERKDGQWKLLVDGKPMILLAGEVHNSSTSSLAYMEEVFDKGKQLGMNCLLLPVTWELIEPEEGHFDFSLVDGLIEQARARKMKIGLLWFGSWKNAQSTYAPEWVKTDLERFRRAQIEKGKNYVTVKKFYNLPYSPLSYLCEETMQADARAFAALMAEIRRVEEARGDKPVLLLDDVLSELDSERQKELLSCIRDTQTMITCTGLDDFVAHHFPADRTFRVVEGRIEGGVYEYGRS